MSHSLDGDRRAYDALLRELMAVLRAFFTRRLSGAPSEVEDLVQETLIAVHTRRLSYDRARAFTPWLFAIARYKLIDYFRRTGATPQHVEFDESVDDLHCFDTAYDETACLAGHDLNRLLAFLPEQQRMLINKTKIEGQSASDMACEFGLSESNVKVTIHRGLRSLMERVQSKKT